MDDNGPITSQYRASRCLGWYPFDELLRKREIVTAKQALREAYDTFGDAFIDAIAAVHTEEWRLLVFSPHARWALMCDPTFDPRIELAKIAAAGSDDVPAEWFSEPPSAVASGILQRILDDDIDTYRAVWLVISFVQSLHLDANTLRSVEWWRLQWWRSRI